jgi:hypothetical protein
MAYVQGSIADANDAAQFAELEHWENLSKSLTSTMSKFSWKVQTRSNAYLVKGKYGKTTEYATILYTSPLTTDITSVMTTLASLSEPRKHQDKILMRTRSTPPQKNTFWLCPIKKKT